VYRFAGQSHPDRDTTHKYLLEEGGAEVLHALRRMGWVDHFAQCVLSGDRPQLADAHDGLWSARMTAAAIQSRESGEVVRFE